MKTVSVVIPIYNEEKYIENCISSIVLQDYPKEYLEVLLVDGMSTDRTRDIIVSIQEKYDWIILLDNPKRIIPSALNIGIRAAEGEFIVRMDAHSEYAADYISKCIETLERTGADNVGGPQITKGRNLKQRIIASAYSSPFALGGGKHFKKDYEGEIDTVFLGAFRKSYAVEMGLYDETMPRNEDDEFNYRIRKNGGKIYMSPDIHVTYFPRDSFLALAKQYYGYGEGKPKVLRKYGQPSNLKQTIPALFVIFLIVGGIVSFLTGRKKVFPLFGAIYKTVIGLYIICDVIATVMNKESHGPLEKLGLFWSHIVIHVSYGLGYIMGLFKKS